MLTTDTPPKAVQPTTLSVLLQHATCTDGKLCILPEFYTHRSEDAGGYEYEGPGETTPHVKIGKLAARSSPSKNPAILLNVRCAMLQRAPEGEQHHGGAVQGAGRARREERLLHVARARQLFACRRRRATRSALNYFVSR